MCGEVLPCYKGVGAECAMSAVLAWTVISANLAAPVDSFPRIMQHVVSAK